MDGALELAFDRRGTAGARYSTRLARLHQAAPLRALFPETCGMDVPVAALTATCGGFTGGDSMRTAIDIGPGAGAMAVAQAAEKLYRAGSGETRIEVALTVEAGGWLEWLPQETILFDGARMRRRTRIDLDAEAAILAGEILVFGRAARGERMTSGLVHDAWAVVRDGKPKWADSFHLADRQLTEALDHPAALRGIGAAAMLVYAGPGVSGRLALLRDMADEAPPGVRFGATLVRDVLVARWLAPDALHIRPHFAAAWTALRADARGLAARLPAFWHH